MNLGDNYQADKAMLDKLAYNKTLKCVGGCDIRTDSDGWILESEGEVGEFYRPDQPDQPSVLAHIDCLPDGGLGFDGFNGNSEGGPWRIA